MKSKNKKGKWFIFATYVLALPGIAFATSVDGEIDKELSCEVLSRHMSVARRAAAEGMVLLANNGTLPLAKGSKVALFGEWENYVTGGGGSSQVKPTRNVGFKAGLEEAGLAVDQESRESAVYVMYRKAEEQWDMKREMYQVSAAERGTLASLRDMGFSRIVLVVNGGLLPNVRALADDGIVDAILWTWYPGQEGCAAIGDILSGTVNPSGRLTNTIAGDSGDFASDATFMESPDYVSYDDDIYVGYRYFETIPGAMRNVRYPFGHGLSYTKWKIECGELKEERVNGQNVVNIKLSVKVTNSGDVAGRHSVLCYTSQTDGATGHPAIELRAFAKTHELAPGESQMIELSFSRGDLASFDDEGWSGRTGSWAIDRGKYRIFVGGSVRDVAEVGSFMVPEIEILSTPGIKGNPALLARRLRQGGEYDEKAVAYPGKTIIEMRTKEDYKENTEKTFSLYDVANRITTLDGFIDQFSLADLVKLTHGHPKTIKGGTGSIGSAFPEMGLMGVETCDGPCGVRRSLPSTTFPCAALVACSFDKDLVYEIGHAIGEEAAEAGFDLLLAPGLCIQRHPLCGRNFEYFSEDPYVSGVMAATYVKGVQSTGTGATLKHFCCNNRETTRLISSSIVSERALREIYLRAFERAVKDGKPWAVMTSYNFVNGLPATAHRGIIDGILRKEWGFDGVTMSDWWTVTPMWKEINGGNDVKMNHDMPIFSDKANWRKGFGERSAVSAACSEGFQAHMYRECLRASAKRVCELVMKTRRFKEALAARKMSHFAVAVPVWPQGRETKMNDFVEFRTTFTANENDCHMLRITGSSVYRIRLNGDFVGYGPARAAKGFFRVDQWKLAAKEGRNELTVEVSAYNCNNFYIPDHPAFLQAEVVAGGVRVLSATGRDFKAYDTSRVTKCSRYSYQRGFGEAYRISPNMSGEELELVEQPAVNLEERIAQYPKFEMTKPFKPLARISVASKKPERYAQARFVDASAVKPWFKCYAETNLDVNIWHDLQNVRMRLAESYAMASNGTISAGQGLQYDAGLNETGFIVLDVVCRKQGTLWVAFDEILSSGIVDPVRYKVGNAVRYDIAPGRYQLEAFEPYTFRYLNAYTLDGEFDFGDVRVRRYRSPATDKVEFQSSDETVNKIFAAARETFAQNSVDVFTDCPSRERAGWLCDSFFLSRASALLTGSTELERLFLQNYLLPKTFDGIPDGMLPMCYPSDALGGQYIPNWAMWFVLQLDEYLARSGDRATVDALKQRILKLKDFLWGYRNADGLLENLPSWVFVEWSEANKLVQDVNYPSNATWAEMLDAIDRMYVMPKLAAEAKHVREAIRQQSWTGKWFCDNAVRQKDGSLALSGKCTETCQYYMFMFGVAEAKSHPSLWQTLVDDFGPKRRETGKYPEVYFSNAFIGNFLRLELLSMAGLDGQVLDETKGYLGYMAERTGTLWEHDGPKASCNHGFASYAANLYARSVLGIDKIDYRNKTITLRKTNAPLDSCEATFPVADGTIVYGWKKDGDRELAAFSAPPGWRKIVKNTGSGEGQTPPGP